MSFRCLYNSANSVRGELSRLHSIFDVLTLVLLRTSSAAVDGMSSLAGIFSTNVVED